MGFLKNQKLGFVGYVLVILMTIISLGIYISNVNKPYYEDMRVNVIVILGIAILALLITLIAPQISNSKAVKLIVDFSRIAATILIIWAGVTFIGMRVESFGYIFGSNLEAGNQAAFDAGKQAVVGIVVFVITWLLAVVVAFMDIGKKTY